MNNFTDGAVQYGSKVLTINSVSYVADNIKVSRTVKKIQRTNEKDRPSGSVYIPQFISGDAQVQLADGTTAPPQQGQTFSVTLDATVGSETFVISEVDNAYTKDAETKVAIKFDKVINSITVES